MIFVQTFIDGSTGFVHYMPFHDQHGLHKTEAELLQMGVLVDVMPEPLITPGKSPVLKHDNGALYYDYVAAPLTPEQETEQLKTKVTQLESEIAALMGVVGL